MKKPLRPIFTKKVQCKVGDAQLTVETDNSYICSRFSGNAINSLQLAY